MKNEIRAFIISLGVLCMVIICVWKFKLMDIEWLYPSYEVVDEYESNDEFSEKVMSDVGDDYLYMDSEGSEIVLYKFELNTNDADSVAKLIHSVNIHYDLIDCKTIIWIADSPSGAITPKITLRNYANTDDDDYDQSGFCYTEVRCNHMWAPFDQPQTYVPFENIKYAEIPDWLQKKP